MRAVVYNQLMSAGTSINFTALDNLKKEPISNGVLLLLFPFGFIIPLIVLILEPKSFLSLVILVAASIFLIRTALNNGKIQKNNEAILSAFAGQNGFEYRMSAVDIDNLSGTLFTHGHSKHYDKPFTGSVDGFPFTLFDYKYATGSGKSRRIYNATVMELSLPRTLPHMVIDSLVEKDSIGTSTLPIVFDKSQRIELEGDFHKFFSLYAPDTYGVSALTIIAPDAMDALMRHAALCDIEIIDNKLYFYWPHLADSKQEYEDMFTTVQEVLAEIGGKLSRGDIFAHESQARVHASGQANGVRLKKQGIQVLTVLSFITYAGVQVISEFTNPPVFLLVLFYGTLGIIAALAINRLRRRQQLLNELKLRYDRYKRA